MQKRERNQKIVFSLRRVQSSTFLKIYGVINMFGKIELISAVLVMNLEYMPVYEQSFHHVLTNN